MQWSAPISTAEGFRSSPQTQNTFVWMLPLCLLLTNQAIITYSPHVAIEKYTQECMWRSRPHRIIQLIKVYYTSNKLKVPKQLFFHFTQRNSKRWSEPLNYTSKSWNVYWRKWQKIISKGYLDFGVHVQFEFDVAKISSQLSSTSKTWNCINAAGLSKFPLPSPKNFISFDSLFMASAAEIVHEQVHQWTPKDSINHTPWVLCLQLHTRT